jgi:hypothetical protein
MSLPLPNMPRGKPLLRNPLLRPNGEGNMSKDDAFERHGRMGRFIHKVLCKLGVHYWGVGWATMSYKIVECDICGTQKDFDPRVRVRMET